MSVALFGTAIITLTIPTSIPISTSTTLHFTIISINILPLHVTITNQCGSNYYQQYGNAINFQQFHLLSCSCASAAVQHKLEGFSCASAAVHKLRRGQQHLPDRQRRPLAPGGPP